MSVSTLQPSTGYRQLLWVLMHQLRNAMPVVEAGVLALQLIAWVRLSATNRLPEPLRFDAALRFDETWAWELPKIFDRLAWDGLLGEMSVAFERHDDSFRKIPSGLVLDLLYTIKGYELAAPADAIELADAVAELELLQLIQPLRIPHELADLMISLAKLDNNSPVYLPFDPTLQLTFRAQLLTPRTFSTLRHRAQWPALLNLLSDSHAHVYFGDEITTPLLLDPMSRDKVRQFLSVIALPPVGVRVDEKIAQLDPFHRFPETTTSYSILAIRHILAATHGRAIIGVPNGILFSTGAELALRESLIKSYVVEGVIALPSALLAGRTMQLSLLILNTRAPQHTVVFVDGANATFHSRDGKARSILTGWETLRDTFLARQDSAYSRVVPTAEILQQGSNLQVVRYCLSPELQAAQDLVATQPLVALKELVQVVRPTLTAEKTGEVSLQEISPGDFPALGYAQVAGRSILVSEQSLGKHSRQLLRKHDVLIAMKGSVGKVALIGERYPSGWVAGQSCLVLRLPDKGPLDARVLFMFLTSEVGQILLKQLVADGSTVPLIQLRELEKLRIPLPSRQEQQGIIDAFEHITAIERQIQELREAQTQATQQYWALQHAPMC